MKVKITNIQRFCLNDGPGIRTTVFFKGCNLKCPWCANPENISFESQEYTIGNENGVYGYDIDLQELKKEILKDKNYYLGGGGVTFSGGEPLLQIKKIEKLLEELKDLNINMCVETALMVNEELLNVSLKYIEYYIVDIKILSKEKCKEILGGDIDLYYKNIETLFNAKKKILFRIPLANKYTYTEENVSLILNLLEKYKISYVEIFNIHNLAENKYKSLNYEFPKIVGLTNEQLKNLKEKIEGLDIKVKVCKL